MGIVAGVFVALGTFVALVFGVPAIFASSGGGILLSAVIAYASAATVSTKIAGKLDLVASIVLLAVVIGIAYQYLAIVDRRPPPFPGASRGGANQPRVGQAAPR